MTLHLIGAGLLVLAGGLFAVNKTTVLKCHLAMLSSLISSLRMMANEIQVNLTPIDEILFLLSDVNNKYAGQFFFEVATLLSERGAPYLKICWDAAIDRCCGCLSQQEQSALRTLGNVLGRYDVAEECTAIDHCISELNIGYQTLRQRYSTDARLYAGLGLTAGCILAITLL